MDCVCLQVTLTLLPRLKQVNWHSRCTHLVTQRPPSLWELQDVGLPHQRSLDSVVSSSYTLFIKTHLFLCKNFLLEMIRVNIVIFVIYVIYNSSMLCYIIIYLYLYVFCYTQSTRFHTELCWLFLFTIIWFVIIKRGLSCYEHVVSMGFSFTSWSLHLY